MTDVKHDCEACQFSNTAGPICNFCTTAHSNFKVLPPLVRIAKYLKLNKSKIAKWKEENIKKGWHPDKFVVPCPCCGYDMYYDGQHLCSTYGDMVYGHMIEEINKE